MRQAECLTTEDKDDGSIRVEETVIQRTEAFRYLGLRIAADSKIEHEVSARINSAWMKWRGVTGVLCDKRIPDRLKSKIYWTVVRPVAIYATECWPMINEA